MNLTNDKVLALLAIGLSLCSFAPLVDINIIVKLITTLTGVCFNVLALIAALHNLKGENETA
ncbi:hypothetical protein P4679_25040 [Priestia megaterium]|uniref:hypothetical protein n=1 Tax=Priestia megaterium TaxID=1404 RepID=UPI002E2443C1|nr:hypothetical protein [Priestia megaterium]